MLFRPPHFRDNTQNRHARERHNYSMSDFKCVEFIHYSATTVVHHATSLDGSVIFPDVRGEIFFGLPIQLISIRPNNGKHLFSKEVRKGRTSNQRNQQNRRDQLNQRNRLNRLNRLSRLSRLSRLNQRTHLNKRNQRHKRIHDAGSEDGVTSSEEYCEKCDS